MSTGKCLLNVHFGFGSSAGPLLTTFRKRIRIQMPKVPQCLRYNLMFARGLASKVTPYIYTELFRTKSLYWKGKKAMTRPLAAMTTG